MARKKSYQKGSVRLRNGDGLYREFNPATRKWSFKRVRLGCFRIRKEALRAAEPIMAQINERNDNPQLAPRSLDVTFKEFIEGRWQAYTVTAHYQPSTNDHHNCLIKRHLGEGTEILAEEIFGNCAQMVPGKREGKLSSLNQRASRTEGLLRM